MNDIPTDGQTIDDAPAETPAEDLAATESLVEEVSIDGMCGVS